MAYSPTHSGSMCDQQQVSSTLESMSPMSPMSPQQQQQQQQGGHLSPSEHMHNTNSMDSMDAPIMQQQPYDPMTGNNGQQQQQSFRRTVGGGSIMDNNDMYRTNADTPYRNDVMLSSPVSLPHSPRDNRNHTQQQHQQHDVQMSDYNNGGSVGGVNLMSTKNGPVPSDGGYNLMHTTTDHSNYRQVLKQEAEVNF